MSDTTSTEEAPPLQGKQLLLGSVALALATFMNVLDTAIANVSIPTIAGDFAIAPDEGIWIITSFAVANAISVPLTGWLTLRFGQVRLFVASVVLFVLASLLCGFAPNIQLLIAARVLQGAVAGPMIPLSQALLLSSYPQQKHGTALAIWSMTTLVAPILGPVAGGWISDNFSWPWIFFINVPVGLFAAAATWQIYRTRESATRKLPIDRVGLALLVIWVGALQITLDKGRELDWFNSTTIVTLALITVIAFVFFLIWELNEEHPIVDLSLFAQRNFSAGVVAFALGYGVFVANLVILPLWLQTQMGYTATLAGIVISPGGFLAMLVVPVVGKNIGKWDPRWVASMSFFTFALIYLMRSRFSTDVDVNGVMITTLLQGFPMALFFVPLVLITLSGLPASRIPSATGLANFFRILFGGFGSSIAATMWDRRSAFHHARLTEYANVYNPVFSHSAAAARTLGIDTAQVQNLFEHTIAHQAGMLGVDDIFLTSSICCFVLIGFVWLAKPVRSPAGADAGGAH